ncbi:Gfo/Idh/MocA family oxidoreductase [Leifsonia sp. ZF2019]|uniref:Gfo/Idh/MocA family protein n=1 Tax=Leifsonia sp. ZF2019 TaxID=2781978 RepID=UPI001CBD3597|nr:Gfo/Idh/MocA family oxidoreductase [Leifsonia sp. ZF2019]UAJ78840.1 Gfo/Idh/MocA family oxidoreductase [Leifsonia sp. ZF2019]
MRLGLIGTGVMGRRYLDAYSTDPNADVVAVCDLDPGRGTAIAEHYSIPESYSSTDEMLGRARLDGVIVATPDFAHRDPVIAALRAGLHVLCEKPLATTVADAVDMVREEDASAGQLMLNFGNRHRPAALRSKVLIEQGGIGIPRYAFLCLNEKSVKTATLAWRDQTSPLWFLMSHIADLVQWLLGDRVASVYATNGAVGGASTTTAVLNFVGGSTAVLESTWDMPAGYQRDIDLRLTIHGSSGVIDLDMGDQGLIVSGDAATRTVQWDSEPGGSAEDWWNRSCRYFSRTIAEGGQLRPDGRDGLATVLVLSALQRSLEREAVISVESEWPSAQELLR